ncbi:hypothetical protein BGZ76_001833 [Entomortierella beljakovae]|nr:hypothetical protein BGZ76_001833 [Entomortierella beljakovae]
MIKIGTFAARLYILFLTLKVIHASVAVCYHTLGPTNALWREVVGFQLWNDRGETASQYRSIYVAKKTKLENNGWTLDTTFYFNVMSIKLKSLYLSSTTYGAIGGINVLPICNDDSSKGQVLYGCYTSDDNNQFCEKHYQEHTNFCKFNYTMGADIVHCK